MAWGQVLSHRTSLTRLGDISKCKLETFALQLVRHDAAQFFQLFAGGHVVLLGAIFVGLGWGVQGNMWPRTFITTQLTLSGTREIRLQKLVFFTDT